MRHQNISKSTKEPLLGKLIWRFCCWESMCSKHYQIWKSSICSIVFFFQFHSQCRKNTTLHFLRAISITKLAQTIIHKSWILNDHTHYSAPWNWNIQVSQHENIFICKTMNMHSIEPMFYFQDIIPSSNLHLSTLVCFVSYTALLDEFETLTLHLWWRNTAAKKYQTTFFCAVSILTNMNLSSFYCTKVDKNFHRPN